MKNNKTAELENYEKEYLERLGGKKKTKSVKQKKSSVKKTKKKDSKKPTSAKTKKPRKSGKKKIPEFDENSGIVLIEDNLEVDKQMELEERKAYLEEARSQEAEN